MGITFDRTTRQKGQDLELKVLDVIICDFLGLSIQLIMRRVRSVQLLHDPKKVN